MGSLLCRDALGCLTLVQVVPRGWLVKRYFVDGESWGPIEVNSADEMIILGIKFSDQGWLLLDGDINIKLTELRAYLSTLSRRN